MATKLNLTVVQGNTFSQVVRWETVPFVFKPITDISRSAPVVITAAAHGIPDGWRAAVVSAGGMTKINATHFPVRGSDLKTVTVLSADSVALHDINSTAYTTYTSGGYLVYYTPVSLSGYTARMTIKDRVGGTVLATLTSGTGEIVLDNTNKTITATIAAALTAAYSWASGVYDLELESGDGVVTTLLRGTVAVTEEVTT